LIVQIFDRVQVDNYWLTGLCSFLLTNKKRAFKETMNPQVQSKGKTSTKCTNTSNTDFADAHRPSKKKVLTRLTSTTSRLILPRPVLTEQQQQQDRQSIILQE
jgi:hypothetical protein